MAGSFLLAIDYKIKVEKWLVRLKQVFLFSNLQLTQIFSYTICNKSRVLFA